MELAFSLGCARSDPQNPGGQKHVGPSNSRPKYIWPLRAPPKIGCNSGSLFSGAPLSGPPLLAEPELGLEAEARRRGPPHRPAPSVCRRTPPRGGGGRSRRGPDGSGSARAHGGSADHRDPGGPGPHPLQARMGSLSNPKGSLRVRRSPFGPQGGPRLRGEAAIAALRSFGLPIESPSG